MLCVCFYLRGQTQREKGRDRESALVLPNSQASNTAQIPRVLLHCVLTKKKNKKIKKNTKHNFNKTAPVRDQHEWNGTGFSDFFFFFNQDKPSRPWMKESDQALNRHQDESCDVTSRHIFWANCFCSVIKTPLQLHVDYESNNTVNKRMFPQQFEESLSVFQLLLSFFLPSNVWQEFKKLGSACCTVCRREFIWGYDSGFGSAANFWL